MQKKRSAIMAILAVVLVAALTAGGTLAYMTDSETLINTFVVGDLDITISEPNYPGGECKDRVPGDSFPKDPTVRAVKGDSYMRVKVEFLDGNGSTNTVITDPERLALIMQTLYFDPSFSATVVGGYKGSANLRVWAGSISSHTPDSTYHYSAADLAGKVTAGQIQNWYNKNDFDDPATGGNGVYYLNYKGIFYLGTSVKVFTSVVFPSDWNQVQMQKLGSYSIRITAEAIQAEGFANRAEAFVKLDAETVLKDYGVTGG
ncbi:MAG: CalY family protein [Oscillospiraceae bacterium]|nr:CalY family protein [Oscillospiraceae bacterium]